MTTKAEQLAKSHTDMLSRAKAQPGVADMLKAYQIQTSLLSTFSTVSQVTAIVEQARAAQTLSSR